MLNAPLVLGFGVIVLGAMVLFAVAWSLPIGLAIGYGYAWSRRAQPGSRASRLVAATAVGLAVGLVASVVALFAGMSGNAGQGVKFFGVFDFADLRLLAPAALAPVIIVVGELAFRRAAR